MDRHEKEEECSSNGEKKIFSTVNLTYNPEFPEREQAPSIQEYVFDAYDEADFNTSQFRLGENGVVENKSQVGVIVGLVVSSVTELGICIIVPFLYLPACKENRKKVTNSDVYKKLCIIPRKILDTKKCKDFLKSGCYQTTEEFLSCKKCTETQKCKAFLDSGCYKTTKEFLSCKKCTPKNPPLVWANCNPENDSRIVALMKNMKVNNLEDVITEDVTTGVQKSSFLKNSEFLKIFQGALGLQDDLFQEICLIIQNLVKDCEKKKYPSTREFISKNEHGSLYGYLLCKEEKKGITFYYAIHELKNPEFELGEAKTEILDIEAFNRNYQEREMLKCVSQHVDKYGISNDEREPDPLLLKSSYIFPLLGSPKTSKGSPKTKN